MIFWLMMAAVLLFAIVYLGLQFLQDEPPAEETREEHLCRAHPHEWEAYWEYLRQKS